MSYDNDDDEIEEYLGAISKYTNRFTECTSEKTTT